jgi:hypothetical protein
MTNVWRVSEVMSVYVIVHIRRSESRMTLLIGPSDKMAIAKHAHALVRYR